MILATKIQYLEKLQIPDGNRFRVSDHHLVLHKTVKLLLMNTQSRFTNRDRLTLVKPEYEINSQTEVMSRIRGKKKDLLCIAYGHMR
jgi:hypothetical protein